MAGGETDLRGLSPLREWRTTQIIRVTGLGNALSIMARDKANQLQTPWLLHWRKTGGWPWEWQLTQAFNEGL